MPLDTSITFSVEEFEQTVEIFIIDDTLVEVTEFFSLSLEIQQDERVFSLNSSAVVSIQDGDGK